MKKVSGYPKGWNKARIQAVLEHYETQTEEAAVAEDEAAFRRRDQAVMVVPERPGPTITKLITRQANGALPAAQRTGRQKSR